ncbi:MAG: hypothetical protein CSB47_03965 [Proteobacteria bacterium]|nr:MAG: hypothetical protein CSB47_03965 [Pseudomonadota bacterium]
MLSQVSKEAALTSLDSIETTSTAPVTTKQPAVNQKTNVNQLTQSIAVRLSELLRLADKVNSSGSPITVESVVSSALKDGKQMDEIRAAVAQATKDITGQNLELAPDTGSLASQSNTTNPTGLSTPALGNPGDTQTSGLSEPLNATVASTNTSPVTRTTTVLAGESLFRVAQRVYGEENGRRFLDLFEANKDIIRDINVVHEGLVLRLPEPVPSEVENTDTQP